LIWISETGDGYTVDMMTLPAPALAAFQAQLPDTVAMVVPRSVLSTMEAVSSIVLTLTVLAVLAALVTVLLQLRGLTRSVTSLARRVETEAGPVMERARSVAENVDFITMAVRNDIQKLNESVSHLNERLMESSHRMEERIQDFTALVEVLQSEAEDLALDTAAAVRGVRAGTRALARRGPGKTKELGAPDAFPASGASDGADE
jgi:methyl-accepting chemotaxis protein